MNCAEVEEVRDLHVLGALTPWESEEVELHLLECSSCREAVRSAWEIARMLRLDAPQVDPSPALRARLLQEALISTDSAPPSPAVEPVHGAPDVGRIDPRVSLLAERTRRWNVAWATGLAAALPLVAAVWLALQVSSLQQRMAQSEEALRNTAQDARTVAELLGRGIQVGAEMARVDGTEMAPSASGMFYFGRAETEGVLVVSGLPYLPRDQVYQLWLVSGTDQMNGGTFVLEDGGKGLLLVKAPMPLNSVDSIAVTMEPMGGSPTPRATRYMWGAVRTT